MKSRNYVPEVPSFQGKDIPERSIEGEVLVCGKLFQSPEPYMFL